MAPPSTPGGTPNGTPKTLSSKLLTMKFMQRAAASPNNSSPATGDQPSDSRPSKRQRLSHMNGASAPSTPTPTIGPTHIPRPHVAAVENVVRQSPAQKDMEDAMKKAMEEAAADQERKDKAARDKAAAEAGEERWVYIPREWDAPPLQSFKSATWNEIEDSDPSDSDDPESERAKFGFKRFPVMGRTRKWYGQKGMKVTAPGFIMDKKEAPNKRKRDYEEPREAEPQIQDEDDDV